MAHDNDEERIEIATLQIYCTFLDLAALKITIRMALTYIAFGTS